MESVFFFFFKKVFNIDHGLNVRRKCNEHSISRGEHSSGGPARRLAAAGQRTDDRALSERPAVSFSARDAPVGHGPDGEI